MARAVAWPIRAEVGPAARLATGWRRDADVEGTRTTVAAGVSGGASDQGDPEWEHGPGGGHADDPRVWIATIGNRSPEINGRPVGGGCCDDPVRRARGDWRRIIDDGNGKCASASIAGDIEDGTDHVAHGLLKC